jgi:hypothetical protein
MVVNLIRFRQAVDPSQKRSKIVESFLRLEQSRQLLRDLVEGKAGCWWWWTDHLGCRVGTGKTSDFVFLERHKRPLLEQLLNVDQLRQKSFRRQISRLPTSGSGMLIAVPTGKLMIYV